MNCTGFGKWWYFEALIFHIRITLFYKFDQYLHCILCYVNYENPSDWRKWTVFDEIVLPSKVYLLTSKKSDFTKAASEKMSEIDSSENKCLEMVYIGINTNELL